jgi:outer membrane autotransporter protein
MKSTFGKITTAIALAAASQLVLATSPSSPPGAIDALSDLLVDIAETEPQAAVGFVIGQICPGGLVSEGGVLESPDLQDRCTEIAVAGLTGDDAATRAGEQAMANEEGAVVASSQVDAGSAQVDSIGQRLSTVRGGGGLVYQQNSSFNWSTGAAGDGSSPWGMFVNGIYIDTDRDSTSRESGFNADNWGVTGGIDYVFSDKLIIGAAFGYVNADIDIKAGGGKVDTDSYSYFAYWSIFPNENWYVDAMAGYTDNDHDQTRSINYSIPTVGGAAGATTTVNNSALSSTDSDEISVSVTGGRNYGYGTWTLSPYGRVDYAHIEIDGYTERMSQTAAAGNGLALRVNDQKFDSLMLSVGGSATGQWGERFFPQLSVEYVHEFKNSNDPTTARFVNDASGTRIVLLTDQPDRNFFNIGVGMTAVITDNLTGYARYQNLLGYKDLDVQSFEFGIRLGF